MHCIIRRHEKPVKTVAAIPCKLFACRLERLDEGEVLTHSCPGALARCAHVPLAWCVPAGKRGSLVMVSLALLGAMLLDQDAALRATEQRPEAHEQRT